MSAALPDIAKKLILSVSGIWLACIHGLLARAGSFVPDVKLLPPISFSL